jgi:hypothetical protein
MSAKSWELVNLHTWKLDRHGYTAVIVRDTSTNIYKPYIRKLVSREYQTVETLEKTDSLHTAMWRCKKWLGKAKKQ